MAKQARGYKSGMLIDFETSFNEGPTTKKGVFLPMNSNELTKKQTLIETETITNTRNDTQPALGRVSVEGDIVQPADYVATGYMLKALFGAPKTTGSAGKFEHIYTVQDEQPSIVVEKAFPDIGQYAIYKGVKINTMKIDYGQDNEMTISYNVMGAERASATTPYNKKAESCPLVRIAQGHAYVRINGQESRLIKEGSVEINANLDGDQYVVGGGGVRGDIPEGLMKANGNFKALFTSTEWMDKADKGEAVPVEVGFKMNEDTQLVFTFPSVQFEPFDANISGPSGVVVDVNWRAFSNNGDSIVKITLKNNKETY